MNEYTLSIDNGTPFKISGSDALDAMKRAGFEIADRVRSGRHYVGRLSDGRRYRVCFQSHLLRDRFEKVQEVHIDGYDR